MPHVHVAGAMQWLQKEQHRLVWTCNRYPGVDIVHLVPSMVQSPSIANINLAVASTLGNTEGLVPSTWEVAVPSALLGSACNVDGVQEMPTVMWELATQVHLHYMAAKPHPAFAQ